MLQVNQLQKRSIAIATIIALVFSAFFLRHYFAIFCTAVILAYLFWPVKTKLRRKVSEASSISLTIIISLLTIIIPMIAIGYIAFWQINNLLENVGTFSTDATLSELGTNVLNAINNFLANIPFIDVQVTSESFINALSSFANTLATSLVNIVKNAASSFIPFFTDSIIFLFVFASILRNSLIDKFKQLNPLGNQVSDLYLAKAGSMIRGAVRGQFIIAVLQGFAGAMSVVLAGYPQLFPVCFIVFSALCIIPLGSGIILIPAGFLMILFGNISGGLIILGTHFLITTNIDNLLRPYLVPADARLDPALMIVSVFSGIAMFGFLGIVIGPTIMILVVTTVQVYLEVFKDEKMKKNVASKESLFSKVKNIGRKQK
jgi:predicted PurR-regulated permease PerM